MNRRITVVIEITNESAYQFTLTEDGTIGIGAELVRIEDGDQLDPTDLKGVN